MSHSCVGGVLPHGTPATNDDAGTAGGSLKLVRADGLTATAPGQQPQHPGQRLLLQLPFASLHHTVAITHHTHTRKTCSARPSIGEQVARRAIRQRRVSSAELTTRMPSLACKITSLVARLATQTQRTWSYHGRTFTSNQQLASGALYTTTTTPGSMDTSASSPQMPHGRRCEAPAATLPPEQEPSQLPHPHPHLPPPPDDTDRRNREQHTPSRHRISRVRATYEFDSTLGYPGEGPCTIVGWNTAGTEGKTTA